MLLIAQIKDAVEVSALQCSLSSAVQRGLASSVTLTAATTTDSDGVSQAAPLQICCYPLAADTAAAAAAAPAARSASHVLCMFRQ